MLFCVVLQRFSATDTRKFFNIPNVIVLLYFSGRRGRVFDSACLQMHAFVVRMLLFYFIIQQMYLAGMSLYSTFVCVLRCQHTPTDVPDARNGESVYICLIWL